MAWEQAEGVVRLPDGAVLRGRGVRVRPVGAPLPDWSLLLLGTRPDDVDWPHWWLRWQDFSVPSDRAAARAAFAEAHRRALAGELVEVACAGGLGRTGTAIACIAQFAGVSAREAVRWTRQHYDPRAIETPWQRRYIRHFTAGATR
ncbi:MAG: hypothetical protein ABI137_04665 [Antricoccus sp.]